MEVAALATIAVVARIAGDHPAASAVEVDGAGADAAEEDVVDLTRLTFL